MKRFEYQVLTLEGLDIEDELNKYGQEGWELVAIDQRGRQYLKREINI